MTMLFDIKGRTKKDMLQLLNAYQQIVDLNVICSVTNPQGTIIYVNDNFCKVSRFSRKELLGQSHRIVNSNYHSANFFRNLWLTISKGNVWRGDVKSKAKDGSYFWLDSTIVPILNESREITGYFSIRIPIDDKKKIEEERQEYVKSLETMLFMISHRIRQPIAQILGLTNIFDDIIIQDKDQKELISYLKQSALTLDTYTKELSSFIHNLEKGNISKAE